MLPVPKVPPVSMSVMAACAETERNNIENAATRNCEQTMDKCETLTLRSGIDWRTGWGELGLVFMDDYCWGGRLEMLEEHKGTSRRLLFPLGAIRSLIRKEETSVNIKNKIYFI